MDSYSSPSPSPPSSPVLGYSRKNNKDPSVTTAAADSHLSNNNELIFCFNCKGQPRLTSLDHSFHPDSLILRRQLIGVVELLRNGNTNEEEEVIDDWSLPDSSTLLPSSNISYFNQYLLNPLDPQDLQTLLRLSRRNVHMLRVISDPKALPEEDELDVNKPWELRKQVIQFFDFMAKRSSLLKTKVWRSMEELDQFFGSFRLAVGIVDGNGSWPAYVKCYNGQRDGNESTSPLYHFFHLLLDIRWSFLTIYGMNSEILKWILDDLVHLAYAMFKSGKGSVLDKQPFNCWCVKELWTMIRGLCEEMTVNFWNALTDSLKPYMESKENVQKNSIFPLWLVSHLTPFSNYTLSGLYTPGREKVEQSHKFNGSRLVNGIVKSWIENGGDVKHCEMMQLLQHLPEYWGTDLDLIFCLWHFWFPKVDKILDVSSSSTLEHYSTVEKWAKLVKSFKSENTKSWTPSSSCVDNFISKDPFLSFLKLLLSHVLSATDKEWKRLKSNLGMNLTKSVVGNYGECGLLRISTLYLGLVECSMGDTLAMCDRLKELLQYGKSTPSRIKTTLKASATAIYILLQKSLVISDKEIAITFMNTVTNLLSQTLLDSGKKESVMVYLQLLDLLPSTCPFSENSLGRDTLISPNLTMWLSSCGQNYVVRTLRTLNRLTEWIINSKKSDILSVSQERDEMTGKIYERTSQFLTSAVILNSNRVPSTDMEPMANLAADLTVFSKWGTYSAPSDSVTRLYDHFALNERTSPAVSQFYLSRLLKHEESCNVTDMKLCQTWIRLNALDCLIPEELNERVLDQKISSTSNEDMLRLICRKFEEHSRGEVQMILNPLIILTKAAVGGLVFKEDSAQVVESIVRTCGRIFQWMEMGKIYLKGDAMCFGTQVLNALVWPMGGVQTWEKLRRGGLGLGLRKALYEMFIATVTYSGFHTDPFLQRKMLDLVTLAVFGFIDDVSDDSQQEEEENPAVRILLYSEENSEELQDLLTKTPIHIMKLATTDIKLTHRFVQAISYLKNKGLTTTVIRFLPGIITAFVNISMPSEIPHACGLIVSYCCVFGGSPLFQDAVLQAFDSVMEVHFGFKSRRFFDLVNLLGKSGRVQVREFVGRDLVPLIKRHVERVEERRGGGLDRALREPLQKLEREISTSPMY